LHKIIMNAKVDSRKWKYFLFMVTIYQSIHSIYIIPQENPDDKKFRSLKKSTQAFQRFENFDFMVYIRIVCYLPGSYLFFVCRVSLFAAAPQEHSRAARSSAGALCCRIH
jgi:hypothetical protein